MRGKVRKHLRKNDARNGRAVRPSTFPGPRDASVAYEVQLRSNSSPDPESAIFPGVRENLGTGAYEQRWDEIRFPPAPTAWMSKCIRETALRCKAPPGMPGSIRLRP